MNLLDLDWDSGSKQALISKKEQAVMTSFRIVQFHAVQKEQAVNKTILKFPKTTLLVNLIHSVR